MYWAKSQVDKRRLTFKAILNDKKEKGLPASKEEQKVLGFILENDVERYQRLACTVKKRVTLPNMEKSVQKKTTTKPYTVYRSSM